MPHAPARVWSEVTIDEMAMLERAKAPGRGKGSRNYRGMCVQSTPPGPTPQQIVERRMGRQATLVLYVLALVAVVVGVDVLFFRNRFWERLMVNVGIVLVFWAFYLRFLKRP